MKCAGIGGGGNADNEGMGSVADRGRAHIAQGRTRIVCVGAGQKGSHRVCGPG
jgi:hypothetical protein